MFVSYTWRDCRLLRPRRRHRRHRRRRPRQRPRRRRRQRRLRPCRASSSLAPSSSSAAPPSLPCSLGCARAAYARRGPSVPRAGAQGPVPGWGPARGHGVAGMPHGAVRLVGPHTEELAAPGNDLCAGGVLARAGWAVACGKSWRRFGAGVCRRLAGASLASVGRCLLLTLLASSVGFAVAAPALSRTTKSELVGDDHGEVDHVDDDGFFSHPLAPEPANHLNRSSLSWLGGLTLSLHSGAATALRAHAAAWW